MLGEDYWYASAGENGTPGDAALRDECATVKIGVAPPTNLVEDHTGEVAHDTLPRRVNKEKNLRAIRATDP